MGNLLEDLMIKLWKIMIAFLLVFVLAACSSDDEDTPSILTYQVALEGSQEVPPVETDGSGSATVTLNEDTGEMTLTGSVSNLSGALFDVSDVGPAHIHAAPRGENGGVAFPIEVDRSADGLNATLSLTATLTAEQASTLQSGGYYINIHTESFNSGEIRGQIE
jgi:hypothetical protein